ncbi:MAG TPA: PQQ-binding-like beta-propeller repeat protein, partial [Ktedonobacterales bacterium]
PLWRLALPGERLTTAMCAANGLLILTAYMSFSPLTIDALAINVNTHALAWRASIPSLPALSGYAPLAADAGLLFVGSLGGSVRALRLSDGSLAWKMRISATVTSGPGATGPVSLGVATRDGLLIVYDSTGEVVSVRPGDGATLWGRPLALVTYAPGRVTLTGSSLYVCGVSAKTALRTLIALDPATGATRWSRPTACALAAPIESGAYLYTLDGFSLTVVRASDGSFVWHGAPAENDLGYVDLSSDDGVIFVATTIANYRVLGLCSDWWQHGFPFCHSSNYIAAFNGATGQSYWRADGYDHLLGLGVADNTSGWVIGVR